MKIDDNENVLGTLGTVSADFHSRYQPDLVEERLESATPGKIIDIDLGKDAIGYRINVGFDRIMICFWSICELHIYNVDGKLYKVINLDGKVKDPMSATFVSSTSIAVAGDNGLHLFNLVFAYIIRTVSKDGHSDVFYHNNTLYAVNVVKKQVEILRKPAIAWQVTGTIDMSVDYIHTSATLVMTSSMVNVCNQKSEVRQYSFDGTLVQTVLIDEHQPASSSRRVCAVDVDGRMVLSVGRQLVIQHNNDSRVVKLKGVTNFYDIVFADQYTFWILQCISISQGKYKIIKYNI